MSTGWWWGGAALMAVAATALAGSDEPLVHGVDLPKKAQALRDDGVPEAEVAEAVRAAKGKGLKADEAEEMLDAAEDAAKENGRIDNFGAFVKSKLDEGLRGRELAAAIKAEHEARGMGGKGKHGKGKAPDGEEGADSPDGEHGKEGKGPPDDKGGPPDDKGSDGEKGEKGKAGKGKAP